jgi:endoglucanase
LGDRVYFESEYTEFGDGYIKAKAIDDRFGCAVLLDLLERETPFECVAVFTVQEEVGLRGARAAAGPVNPDFAVVIEATTAADIPAVSGSGRCCALGGGAVTAFMDKSAIYDKELFELSKNLARASNIGWQTKTVIAGGNDAGAVQTNGGGVRTIAVCAPCRYLHSPSCVVKRTDVEDCLRLTELLSEKIYQATPENPLPSHRGTSLSVILPKEY